VQPKAQPNAKPKAQLKAQPNAKPTKKDNVVKDIVNEWDTPQISIILFQTKIGNEMRITIEKLVRDKMFF
jgi:hypothetical protein